MKDERRVKINKIKANLKEAQDKITELVSSLIKEEDEEKKKELRISIAAKKSQMSEMRNDMFLTRVNKNSSAYFEWHPHKGMNRQQARLFRRKGRV